MNDISASQATQLNAFFSRPLCVQAARSLGKSARLRIRLDDGDYLLGKEEERLVVQPMGSNKPDLSFKVPAAAMRELYADNSEDLGELAIKLLKLIGSPDPAFKISPSLHIGVFDFVLKGYAGLITAGGPSLMKQLASRGLGNLSKIKSALASFRTES